MAIGAQEYTVTVRFRVVTKEDRRHIAEAAWAVVKEALGIHGPDWRSGELVEITPVDPPKRRLRG